MSSALVTVFRGTESGRVVKSTQKPQELRDKDVAVKITHSGVCGTDLHQVKRDIVLGHEGIGIVENTGKSVTNFKKGDRVGFGYVHGGCLECDQCKKGFYYRCANNPQNYGETPEDSNQGSFASEAVFPDTAFYHIPEGLTSEQAAPLMCAGKTVITPMLQYGIKKGDRVGVVGIGGLGHLAIQFAAKLGAEVVVISSNDSKREEAVKLGASEFHLVQNLKQIKGIDYLLVTANKHLEWAKYMDIMNPFGRIFPLEIDWNDLVIPFGTFLLKELSFTGSCAATPEHMNTMLKFAADNGVQAMVERFPLTEEGVSQAIEKLENGSIRYRAVLVAK